MTPRNKTLIDERGFDLHTRMLIVDHMQRITALEAIAHDYFVEVRTD